MNEQQQQMLAQAVENALRERNLTVNAASIRLGIDRNALTRFKAGKPLTLELVERFARGLRYDVNEWRELCGYPRIEPSDPNEALDVVVEHSQELTYDADLEGLDDVRKYEGFGKLSPEAQAAILRITRAIISEERRKQGRE